MARHLAVMCLMSLALGACDAHPDRQSLIGVYRLDYEFGSEVLRLNPNGTYVETLSVRGRKYETSNRWQYAARDGKVSLEGAFVADDGFGKLSTEFSNPKPGSVVLQATDHGSLTWDEDLGLAFKKIPQ